MISPIFFVLLIIPMMMYDLKLVNAFSVLSSSAMSPKSATVEIELHPLIGGPSFLPVHSKVKIITDDSSRSCYYYDFIPLDATNSTITNKLIQLQAVPGIIRSPNNKNKDNNVNENEESSEDDTILQKADDFVNQYTDTNLHLITNNCWTFALQLYWKLVTEEDEN